MGSSNSRLGGSGHPPPPARPPHHLPQRRRRRPSFKRNLSCFLVCGASSSIPHNEIEDEPAELLVSPAEHVDVEKIMFPAKSSTLSTDCGNEYPQCRVVNGNSSENLICCNGNHSSEDVSQISETEKSIEGLSSEQSTDNLISNETTGMSSDNEHSPETLIADSKANVDSVDNGKGLINEVASGNAVCCNSCDGSSSDAVESCDEMSHENEVMIFRECDFTSGSAPSESSLDCTLQTSSSGVGSSVADMEEDHRNGNELQIDRAIVSSNLLSNNNSSGLTNQEARHSNRRLFWDSFSRRNLRRNANARTFLFGPDDTDGLGFHGTSLFDLNSDFFDYEVGGSSRFHRGSSQIINEPRSSSEVWERSRDIDNGSDRQCPIGIHPDGTCSCGSIFIGEDSGPRASISRIVMLAEALFEVMDDAHRQPTSLSMPMVSRPAPEAVVDSLPVKNYSELERTEGRNESIECYICLNEYGEGDAIRVLPCHHEFHMVCIDKWLKEIHGVCPLCRGDVREGSSKGSVSS